MGTNDRDRISTDDVLARLERAGLTVSANMLGQDVKAGYLPRREMDPRGPQRGIGRWWEPWVMQRALYLYRLRHLGIQGDLLRVLLFLRDGWGWEQVQPLCLKGFIKLVNAQRGPVRRHVHKEHLDATTLHTISQDIAGDLSLTLPATRFIWGMGMFGSPLEDGSVEPLVNAVQDAFLVDDILEDPTVIAETITALGLTWERMLAIVEAADDRQADQGRRLFLQQLRHWRSRLVWRVEEYEVQEQSTNLLTMGGRNHQEIAAGLRQGPQRMTPAQLLAAVVSICLVLGVRLEEGLDESATTDESRRG